MPIVIASALWAAASRGAASASAADARMMTLVFMSVPVDPFLGVDPALEIAGLNAARLGAGPGVVRLLGLAHLVVDDAEVDERLRRIAGEVFEHADLVGLERQRGAIHRDPPLGVAASVLVGERERPRGRAELAVAPLVDRDRLVARRQQLLDLVTEAAFVDQAGEVGRGLLAGLQRAVAVAGVGGEQLRAEPGVRA